MLIGLFKKADADGSLWEAAVGMLLVAWLVHPEKVVLHVELELSC